ncbi:uncharacterized protein LOC110850171 [Folsomia candida]|uniref:uncharacterized protein LOC110850171 n=1 Tax=Folsomia candida TaxID=158441 RepID=UPI000B8F9CC5|nr:uncharacterized protein LOC110850171 [Folsomia candida]XP_035707802.1 uncharacterized protein LOC110850171 [Folsomia candida]XP_035707803.1 uncharacterized protein LOC110850171 [Folsomia candida]
MSETCCFGCCTVGQGTLTIGILNIIGGILSVVQNSIGVYLMINDPDRFQDSDFHQHESRYITIGCIQIFMAIVFFILACVMVHGYRVRNHRLIKPWLVWSYVSLGVGAVVVMLTSLVVAAAGEFGVGFAMLTLGGLFLAVQTYFVFVVRRFVDELKGGGIY